uniref:Uncharacterized protein n=1 Tax=Onchocerca volvulus TaxID=6282 RepID=A0A8R1TNR0_ONCVO
MRVDWIILLLSLMLPVMIANNSNLDISMREKNAVNAIEKQDLPRSHRFKRQYSCGQCGGGGGPPVVVSPCQQCKGGGAGVSAIGGAGGISAIGGGVSAIGGGFGGGGGDTVAVVCCGATGLKGMFRNWWLHIPLLLLPMSMSWIKALFL